MPNVFSYNKKEKLKSKKLLDELFKNGKSISVYPIKAFYLETDFEPNYANIKTGVGVSKRYFKHATKRNYIKRVLRECYRKNKLELHNSLTNNKKQLALFFLYTDNEILPFNIMEEKVKKLLEKITNQFN